MKFDSRLILLAVLALGAIAFVGSLLTEQEPDEVVAIGTSTTASQLNATAPTVTAEVAETTSATATPTTVSATTTVATTTTPTPKVLADVHPRLVDIDGWLQSEVETLEELRGQVAVVEFWTFGCYNCKNRIPYTQEIYAKYRDQGLEIVGIHSPEFEFEEDVDNIKDAIAKLGVTWPVVLDTRRRTLWEWQTGGRAYWPRTYVLDREGRVRYDHIGEGKYQELEQTVAFLLNEEM